MGSVVLSTSKIPMAPTTTDMVALCQGPALIGAMFLVLLAQCATSLEAT